jgi:uncharacterized membrane protein (DUF485 family)
METSSAFKAMKKPLSSIQKILLLFLGLGLALLLFWIFNFGFQNDLLNSVMFHPLWGIPLLIGVSITAITFILWVLRTNRSSP